MSVRVRFAPSPTGFLHVGGARTAIFNWLLARREGGRLVLRIEDTDRERSSEEMVEAILDGLAWLGVEADEGPFFQSAGRDRHAAAAARLLESGHAYRDFTPPEVHRARREEAERAGRPFVDPRTDRELDPAESARRAEAGEPHAVRFRSPDEGEVTWEDRVHGPTRFPTAGIEDFVILRSDGSPTYMLSVVCDDVEMRISHVVRGDDHLSNTPKQILLYRALGAEVPTFAHLPLILGTDRKRLSKRHGAVSVLSYRDEGILPEAMLNFLALLGWNPGEERERYDADELIARFGLDRVGRSGAIFDLEKLGAINREHFLAMDLRELARRVRPTLEAANLWNDALATDRADWFHAVLALLRDRCRRLDDFVRFGRPFLDESDTFDYDEKASKKHLKGAETATHLAAWASDLESLEPWNAETLETRLRDRAEALGVGAGKLIHPTRLAVTGSGVSPGLFEVLELLGRERSLSRLRRLGAQLNGG